MKKNFYLIFILLFSNTIWISCNLSADKRCMYDEKPKYMWFDAEANYQRFLSKDSITYYLDKTKKAGFNQIVVDVRPLYGDALYQSDILPPMNKMEGIKGDRDWDYLQFFIDEARKRDLKVSVSTTIFTGGRPHTREGMAYRTNDWDDKVGILYTPDGLISIKEDPSKVAVFLNPVIPEVQEFCLSFIKEITQKYDIDGYALDYCRYSGFETDFSETSKHAFEQYIGKEVEDFPRSVFTWEKDKNGNYYHKPAKYYQEWFEFRAKIIHDFIAKTRNTIKAIKPEVKLEYWSPSWYPSLYLQGQNWASKQYDPSVEHAFASSNYKNTGFADLLDVFMCGTYLNKVYGLDEPESIEYGLARANELIQGDNIVTGSIYALNYQNIEDATYVALSRSEGLVMFDIVQVIEFNLWDDIKKGIDRAEKEAIKN